MTPVDGRGGIDAGLVRRLVKAQFPQWADLPVEPVKTDGWDNRTYRLGSSMTVRLPSAAAYAPAVDKEEEWIPRLAPFLPVPVPELLGKGVPGEGYDFHWSVRRWLVGEASSLERISDLTAFAVGVGEFLLALQACDATGGPVPGGHNFHRGGPPAYNDSETRAALVALDGQVDVAAAREVWEAALASSFDGPPVWFHGDIASGNLLVRDGELSAVIDFGTSGVGDPACDLVIAWTMFSGASRDAFRRTVAADAGTWARARGWALWKALIVMAGGDNVDVNKLVIDEVLADHQLSL
jgi:aminoglycoside phosphotransferase (APT) family kinase protein